MKAWFFVFYRKKPGKVLQTPIRKTNKNALFPVEGRETGLLNIFSQDPIWPTKKTPRPHIGEHNRTDRPLATITLYVANIP